MWAVYAIGAYFLAFVLLVAGLFLWWARRRKERPPEKFTLLRGPGETQRRRVQKADEEMFFYFFVAAFSPLVLFWLVLLAMARTPKNFAVVGAAIAVLVFVGSLLVACIRLFGFLRRRRDDLIGYLGERAVAECLEALKAEGFRAFYDVPRRR